MAPEAIQEVLLDLPPLHFAARVEAKASIHKLGDSGLRYGRGSDVGSPNNGIGIGFILFSQMRQNRMIPMIAFGTPIKVDISWSGHWI